MQNQGRKRKPAAPPMPDMGMGVDPAGINIVEDAGYLPTAQGLEEMAPVLLNVIGREQVAEALITLKKYQEGKQKLDERIVSNEDWWVKRHTEAKGEGNGLGFDVKSAWAFNSMQGKHADMMANYPDANIMPREEGDKEAAKALSQVLPVVLERNGFEKTYSDVQWYKLRIPAGVYCVSWDGKKEQGIGDISIKKIDLLNVFWKPGINDIQDSPHFFHLEAADIELLKQEYPQLKHDTGASSLQIKKYNHDTYTEKDELTVVVDWYYKKMVNGKQVLHYCKFCNGIVLYATENVQALAQRGLYDHGKYPYVFETSFPVEKDPVGFCMVDIMRSPQQSIDMITEGVVINAGMLSQPRWLLPEGCKVNVNQFADWKQQFITVPDGAGRPADLRQLEVKPIGGDVIAVRAAIIDELKETSGNRDVNQGSTSGVTAYSAIAALQEAGSKGSRDMLKGTYDAYKKVCEICISLIKQFYTMQRTFRIVGEKGAEEFINFQAEQMGTPGKEPVYDIMVRPQKANNYTKMAQNELAKELLGMGMFDPARADVALMVLSMMDFEGKDDLISKIQLNGTLYANNMMMMQMLAQLATLLQGTPLAQEIAQRLQQMMGAQAGMQGLGTAPAQMADSNKSKQLLGQETGWQANVRARSEAATDPNGGSMV